MTFRVIRSNRKSISLQVDRNGILVRAPQHAGDEYIRRFVLEHREWIEKKQRIVEEREEALDPPDLLSREELERLGQEALRVIPGRVQHFAPKVGVTYGRITIRNQRTRWGSCSSKGNLNFNCLLMLAPPEVLDSVVVHELCHRKEMSHSKYFYEEVLRVMPDYWKRIDWLKEHGHELMRRMTGITMMSGMTT